MEGSRRQQSPQAEPSPTELTTLSDHREVAVAERPFKKTCHSSVSTSSTLCEPHVWPGLLDSLLHQIIALLSSFQDLLLVAPAALGELHYLPSRPYILSPCHLSTSNQIYLISLSIVLTIVVFSTPRHAPNSVRYLGCSYGYLIFSNHENCLLVDVYTGAKVKPPKLRFAGNREIYYVILMAPLTSPNSHLLLCSKSSIFCWQVGTNSWSKHPFGGERILQIVLFKGEMFAMDFLDRLHTMRFAPQLSIHEVAAVRQEEMVTGHRFRPWLVVCDDMLLMVDFSLSNHYTFGTFLVFRLDTSAETTKWTKMEKLENQALFVILDRRSPTFSLMNPERWGGKSNCIYLSGCYYGSWTAIEIGQPVKYNRVPLPAEPIGHFYKLESLWALPSFIYGVDK